MFASKDPGVLGFYGFRNRSDHSYDRMSIAMGDAVREKRVWDYVGEQGGRSVVVGVPQTYPVRPIRGTLISGFLTPSTDRQYTYPNELRNEIDRVLDGRPYDVDVPEFRTSDKDFLIEQVWAMTEKRAKVVKHLIKTRAWDLFLFVEIGLDRMHHGMWKYWDPDHPKHDPGNNYVDAIPEYYRYLDRELGEMLDLLDDDTIVMVVSDHGAQAMHGGFAINEWLRREGLLTLKDEPRYEGLVPFEKVEVDWERTVAWAAGGYYARVFLNVLGREPSGVVPPEKYESTRDRLKEMIEGIPDDQGRRMGSVVYKPEELYRDVRNVAPDLMVYLDSLRWRAIGSFGLPSIYVHENDLGPDDANHAQNGVFILWDPRHKYSGQFTSGLQLMDVAPTIMESLGFAVPAGMQGKPVARQRMVGCG